jgi:adenylate kinase
MNLIFLGYPASGKGTVAKGLSGFNQISTGDLLRAEIASGSALGKEISEIINKGNLVNDQMALKLIQANFKPNQSYIFDGFPRTLKQA